MELAKTRRAYLAIGPSRWWTPPVLAGIFIFAVFTFNSAMRAVPKTISSSSSSSTTTSSVSLPWPPLSRPSTATMQSSNQHFPLLVGNSLSSHAIPHQEKHILPSTSIHKSRHLPYMPYLKQSFSSSHDEQSSPPSIDLKSSVVNESNDIGHVDNGFSSSPDSAYVRPYTSVHKSTPHPYMSYLKQAVSSSHDQSSRPPTDLKSSMIDHSSDLGHVHNGWSSSPDSTNDVMLSLATRIDSRVHGYNDNLKSFSIRTDGKRHVHNGYSSSTPDSTNPHCDIYIGRWVEDDTYPLYKPGSCPFIEEKFNCQQNGRPDVRYTRWRWAPRDCSVPRFNGTDMLERLRGKRLAFVGDSLSRNQWESMLCMLRESIADKSRVVRTSGSDHIIRFLDYDFSVELYTSTYLVDTQQDSNQTHITTIRLDTMDKSEIKWRKANVLVFNTAHWWGPSKVGQGENIFQEGNKVHSKLEVMVAYKKALSTWAKWVDRYINPQNTTVFFRSYSPLHYQGGQWNSGGHCEGEIEPIYEGSDLPRYHDDKKMQTVEKVLQKMRRVPVHVLNITRLSGYRKDAHPALYAHPQEQQQVLLPHQDCGHWCLPGLPDTWNDLLFFALTAAKQTTSLLTA